MLLKHRRRPQLSQNFLHNRQLVKKLIGSSFIDQNDLVLEIGPGKGIITERLIKTAQKVIAIELDKHLFYHLNQKFKSTPNLKLYHQDFLQFHLPQKPYKVFANLPFAIEGKTVRKLLNANNPPEDCYLVIRKDLAQRLSGTSYHSQFSILYKPWFEFEIFHHFNRPDFIPKPKVQATMLRFTKRNKPLLPLNQKQSYHQFILNGFNTTLKPTSLSFTRWLSLYNSFSLKPT